MIGVMSRIDQLKKYSYGYRGYYYNSLIGDLNLLPAITLISCVFAVLCCLAPFMSLTHITASFDTRNLIRYNNARKIPSSGIFRRHSGSVNIEAVCLLLTGGAATILVPATSGLDNYNWSTFWSVLIISLVFTFLHFCVGAFVASIDDGNFILANESALQNQNNTYQQYGQYPVTQPYPQNQSYQQNTQYQQKVQYQQYDRNQSYNNYGQNNQDIDRSYGDPYNDI